MHSEHLTVSRDALLKFGLNPHHCDFDKIFISDEDIEKQNIFAYGRFENIIKTIFSNGNVDIRTLLSSTSSPEVREFVDNFLMKEISTMPPSSTDEEAFATIIPRLCQTESELRPYLDGLKGLISEARRQLEESQDQQSKTD